MEQDGVIGSTQQPIISGYFLPQASANVSTNMVTLPGCSAVAIDSQWILTAAHCGSPSSATLYYPSETSSVRERETFSGTDVALVRVHPFTSGLIKPFQLWNGGLNTLLGQPLTCAGQGNNTFLGGAGTWRWAELSPSIEDGIGYRFYPNAGGQIQWSGDSGGPCLLGSGSSWKITGIQSSCSSNPATQEVTSCYQDGLTVSLTGRVEDYR